jgi:hypothetical protein
VRSLILSRLVDSARPSLDRDYMKSVILKHTEEAKVAGMYDSMGICLSGDVI